MSDGRGVVLLLAGPLTVLVVSRTLRWTFDHEQLLKIKAAKPVLKLFVYKTSVQSPSNDNSQLLGTVALDWRSPIPKADWIKLQGACDIELKLAVSLGPVSEGKLPVPADHVVGEPVDPEQQEEFLQIGHGTDNFTLSVTLHGASNLDCIVQGQGLTFTSEQQREGFWLSYSTLDVVVHSEAFNNLEQPDMPPICDTFRFRSSLEELIPFFEDHALLPVFLCTLQQKLGTVQLPLGELLSRANWSGKDASQFSQVEVSDNFCFDGYEDTRRQPLIHAALCLRNDSDVQQQPQPEAMLEPPHMPLPEINAELFLGLDSASFDPQCDITKAEGIVVQVKFLPSDVAHESDPIQITGEAQLDQNYRFQLDDSEAEMLAMNRGEIGSCLQISFVSVDTGDVLATGTCDNAKATILHQSEEFGLIACEPAQAQLWVPSGDGEHQQIVGVCEIRVGMQVSESLYAIGAQHEDSASNNEFESSQPQASRSGVHMEHSHVADARDDTEVGEGGGIMHEHPQCEERLYRCSIDLRSVKDLRHSADVFLQYHYPLFGTVAPVRTKCSRVMARSEQLLPETFRSFEFAMSPEEMEQGLDEELVVNVWQKDRFNTMQIGAAVINLQAVRASKSYYRCGSKTFPSMESAQNYRRSQTFISNSSVKKGKLPPQIVVLSAHDSYYAVESVLDDEMGKEIGLVRAVVYLEDLGIAPVGSSLPSKAAAAHFKNLLEQQSRQHYVDDVPTPAGSAVDQNVAVQMKAQEEWERWREQEEVKWAAHLRTKEEDLVRSLQQAFERKEQELSNDVLRTQDRISSLETKMRKSLLQVEGREKKLIEAEAQMKRDCAQRMEELQILQRRLRAETHHQVSVSKQQSEELQQRLVRSEEALRVAEARNRELDDDFSKYRQRQRSTPEAALRFEIAKLQRENQEWQAQLANEREAKLHEAQQKNEYHMRVGQLARLVRKQRHEKQAKAHEDLEQLRLQYVAREQRFLLDGDRQELQTIKQELDLLRHVQLVPQQALHQVPLHQVPPQPAPPEQVPCVPPSEAPSPEMERLAEEKEALLRTGYDPQHVIVQELDKRLGVGAF